MQKHMSRTEGERGSGDAAASTARSAGTSKAMGRKLDALLDEIDDVLERNAKEFVAAYVQYGGE